jgi:hypothetical protein
MYLKMTSFRIALIVMIACIVHVRAQCKGSFDGEPCTSQNTSGACVGLATPCAPGFECSPVFTCIKGMEPLLATCNGTSDACLFVKADNSSTARGRCADERCEEVVPSTSTLALLPNSTVSMTFDIPIKTHDPCNSKDDGEPCVINGKTGKCVMINKRSVRPTSECEIDAASKLAAGCVAIAMATGSCLFQLRIPTK